MIYAPHSEKQILGAILQGAEVDVEVGDFYLDSNRKILVVIQAMRQQGKVIDTLTVMDELGRRKLLDAVGGYPYVTDLTSESWKSLNVKPHVRIVREKAALRSIVSLCEVVSARAQEEDSSEDLLHELQARALEFQAAGVEVKPTEISEHVLPVWESMKHQRNFKGDVVGIPTGIPSLDASTTGWRNGELTYVGALPGRGKTSFMLQAMFHAATCGFGVGCISLEMRSSQLMRRLAILRSGLYAQKFRDVRTMNVSEFETAKSALFALGELPVTLCDQSSLRPPQIASLARQMRRKGASIIFIDFVQIIHEDGKDRREAINRVSAAIRDTCKDLDIPFVVASQLARRDADPNRRPTLMDLKESGNLETDCHNALLLFRPKDKSTGEWTGEDEIVIDKQREGVTGIVPVRYDERSLSYVER